MTTSLAEKNIRVRDADGDWYIIPTNLEDEFVRIKESIIDTEIGSTDWSNSTEELSLLYSKYKIT